MKGLLSRSEEIALFSVIEAAHEKIRELSSSFLFMPGMYLSALDKLFAGDECFDRIVSADYTGGCKAYKADIKTMKEDISEAADKLYGAYIAHRAAQESGSGNEIVGETSRILRESRKAMHDILHNLSFRRDVVVSMCDAAHEEIFKPYMRIHRDEDPSKVSAAQEMEEAFGMSPDEFIATFEELWELMCVARDAEKRIVESNLRLVVSVAKKYVNKGCEFADLVQEGCMGLVWAAQKYDAARGHKFSTYATWWIRKAILSALTSKSRTIRIPSNVVDMLSKLRSLERTLARQGVKLSEPEIAKKLKISLDRLSQLRVLCRQRMLSLDGFIWEGEDATYGDMAADESAPCPAEEVDKSLRKEVVQAALRGLSDRERLIIDMRYGLSDGNVRSLGDVGALFNVSREHIRRIEAAVLEKLRKSDGLKALAELCQG